MYLEYYSLDRPPFRITPDPSLFYTGGANGRGVVLEALLYAVSSGEGILKVVGEVGSGKTMLCRMLEERLPDSVEVVYLANPNLSSHDILYAIAFELHLPVDHSTQRLVLMQHLQAYLLKQHADNRTVVVIIEEAQSMPIETLEEVRLFSNLETHQHKLMQIVLFGQPELDKNLQQKNIRQLRERITHSFDLRPLTADEVSDYIRFRLQAAGCPAPQVFSDAAERLIAKASGGLTRRINILADKAMLAAYAESATGQRPRMIDNKLQAVVFPKHVRAAIKDSGYKPKPWNWGRLGFVATVAISIAAGAIAWPILNEYLERPLTDTVAVQAPQRDATSAIQAPEPEASQPPRSASAVAEPPSVANVESSTAEQNQSVQAPATMAAAPDQNLAPPAPPAAVASTPVADNPTFAEVEPMPEQTVVATAALSQSTEQVSATVQTASRTAAPDSIEREFMQVAADELVQRSAPAREEPVAVASTQPETPAVPQPAIAPEENIEVMVQSDSEPEVTPEPVERAEPVYLLPSMEGLALLQERSAAFSGWMQGVVATQKYTVQVLTVPVSYEGSEYVDRVLGRLQRADMLDETYTCVFSSRGTDIWKVVYGGYSSVVQATRGINSLPRSVQSNGPYVQSISKIDCNSAVE